MIKKVLVIWPPEIPVYFNAGHHLAVFQVGAYLRRRFPELSVTCIDAGVLNYTWKDIAMLLADGEFELAAVANEFGSLEGVIQFSRYVRGVLPNCRILTFGRMSLQAPTLFDEVDIDAVVASGDNEAGAAAAVQFFSGMHYAHPGVRVRTQAGWQDGGLGTWLLPTEWEFPDPSEIPYEAYERQYADDTRKFCGIPERRELVVPVARGCPVGCFYCEVPKQQGRRERRKEVHAVFEYIRESFDRMAFEYVSFYAPTFTLDRAWVASLCELLSEAGQIYPWKCVTTIAHLDDDLIRLMGRAGCVRISVGLEALDAESQRMLPKPKRVSEDLVRSIASECQAAGIELNCFVILGLPGQTPEAASETIRLLTAMNVRIRPTIYSAYQKITGTMSLAEASQFDRQFITQTETEYATFFNQMLHQRDSRVTDAQAFIPRRG